MTRKAPTVSLTTPSAAPQCGRSGHRSASDNAALWVCSSGGRGAVGTRTQAPYSTLGTRSTNGTHSLTAIARDAAGNTGVDGANRDRQQQRRQRHVVDDQRQPALQTIDGFGISANSASWNGGAASPSTGHRQAAPRSARHHRQAKQEPRTMTPARIRSTGRTTTLSTRARSSRNSGRRLRT